MLRNIYIALVIALFILLSGVTMAQKTINASATVVNVVSMSQTSPLGFGSVNTGGNPAVSADPKVTASTGTTQGYYVVSGGAGEKLNFTFPKTIDLTNTTTSGSNNHLYVLVTLYGGQVAGGTTGASSLSTDASVTSESLNASGNYYFWVGGTLNPGTAAGGLVSAIPATQNHGDYSGFATVTIDYN